MILVDVRSVCEVFRHAEHRNRAAEPRQASAAAKTKTIFPRIVAPLIDSHSGFMGICVFLLMDTKQFSSFLPRRAFCSHSAINKGVFLFGKGEVASDGEIHIRRYKAMSTHEDEGLPFGLDDMLEADCRCS